MSSDPHRCGFYPVRVSLNITDEDSEALDRLSKRTGVARAALAREAFQRGLPLVSDMYRQRSRRIDPESGVPSPAAAGEPSVSG